MNRSQQHTASIHGNAVANTGGGSLSLVSFGCLAESSVGVDLHEEILTLIEIGSQESRKEGAPCLEAHSP